MLKIEKIIRGKLTALENTRTKAEGIEIIKEAKLNEKLNALMKVDIAAAEELQERYMNAVKANSQKA
jgi:hypothetical protein